jgi:alpha-maltose-1-phosphate synthase
MDIIQVSHMFLDGGGREEHIYQISKYLALKGHRVTIVTSDYSPSGEHIIKRKADKIPGIKIVTIKGYLTKIPPGRVQIPDLIDFLMDYKADIIHAHGMGEQPAEEAFYAAKIKKVPFVFTLHFAPYDVYKKLNAEHIWKVIQQYQVYNMLRGTDKIIAVSPNEKEDIIKYTGYSGNNFEVIPNGFERPQEKITPQLIKDTYKKYGIPEGRKYIVFLGALTNPRKGAFEAIQAYRAAKSKIPDLFLILMGTWDSRLNYAGQAKTTTKVLEKLAKANNVMVTGWLNEIDKFAILAGSNLFVSPTYYEAFGIALCEALYSKIPVISTNRGGCKYVVHNGVDGILVKNPEDIMEITQAIIKIISNPIKAKKMGLAGFERVRKTFSWEKTGEKLEKVYQKLIVSSVKNV